jgi:hypothetical protein
MSYWRLGPIPLCLLVIFLSAPLAAEEFYLKDGTKIVGTIVGFEEKAFRVETSFGFAIIYKDKIERIVFTGSTPQPVLGAVPEQALPSEPVVAESSQGAAAEEPETEKSLIQEAEVREEAEEAATEKESTAEKESAPEPASEPAQPEGDVEGETPEEAAKPLAPEPAKETLPRRPTAPAIPTRIIEQVTRTRYVNHTYRFQLYKPPTWRSYPTMVRPQKALVAALGTPDEATLLLIGRERYTGDLLSYARLAEPSLQRLYQDYRKLAEVPTQVAGLPALERRFTGTTEGRFWTGMAIYFARGREYFTLLGVTAAGETVGFQQAILRKVVNSLAFFPEEASTAQSPTLR